MKLAIFPGTFNPIHLAHLIIAEHARIQFKLDKIIFITAKIPPHRHIDIAPPEHRHKMVETCCRENEFFEASNIELAREGTSYTYHTLIEIKELYNTKSKISFIIGIDALSQIATWVNAQSVVDMSHFLIVSRPGYSDIEPALEKTGLKNFCYDIIQSPLLEISSTFIRNRIASNLPIKYLVRDKTEEYIQSNNLYKTLEGIE